MDVNMMHAMLSTQNCWWIIRGPATIKMLNLRDLVRPSSKWGPALAHNRKTPAAEEETGGVAAPEENYAVAYSEGQCFVVGMSSYTEGDSHIWSTQVAKTEYS